MNNLRLTRARALAGFVVAAAISLPAAAQSGDVTLLRVFLLDGTTLVSYGEYARVGDRVVFSMPLGKAGSDPKLNLVNIPATAVDWSSTERYAESARATRYAETRGEADFVSMTAEVAAALNTIGHSENPSRRLDIAVAARRRLADWPATHYGYRQTDVRQILGLLDEAIAELRAATGAREFDLSFVASPDPPPPMALLPEPTPAEAVQQAVAVVGLTEAPAERLSLLQSIVAFLDTANHGVPRAAARIAREEAATALAAEMKIERAYTDLSHKMLSRATQYANRADVRGIDQVLHAIHARDDQLGRKRPDAVNALITAVQSHLESARRLRLKRDRWALRVSVFQAYRVAVKGPMDVLDRLGPPLAEIKALSGPEPRSLTKLADRLGRAVRTLTGVLPPSELVSAHGLLQSALQLAQSAVRIRSEAVASGDLGKAWDASAAAAGSQTLLDKARTEMEAFLKPPQLR
jgi:hypothetical protein